MTTAGLSCWNNCWPVRRWKARRGQRVLIGPTVERLAHQLFGCGVGHRADRHIGGGQTRGVLAPMRAIPKSASSARLNLEIRLRQKNIRRLDVAVQQLLLMRVVQRVSHARHYPHDILGRQAAALMLGSNSRHRCPRRSPS